MGTPAGKGTKVLKAVSQAFGFLVLMFCSIKPRIPLAVAVIRSMWVFQGRPLEKPHVPLVTFNLGVSIVFFAE